MEMIAFFVGGLAGLATTTACVIWRRDHLLGTADEDTLEKLLVRKKTERYIREQSVKKASDEVNAIERE